MQIAMIGSGYVGLVWEVCFADFGHDVVCIDKEPAHIAIVPHVLVIVTEWDEIRALDPPRIKTLLAAPNLIDLRNVYRPADVRRRISPT